MSPSSQVSTSPALLCLGFMYLLCTFYSFFCCQLIQLVFLVFIIPDYVILFKLSNSVSLSSLVKWEEKWTCFTGLMKKSNEISYMGKCLEQRLADNKHYANIIAIILIISIVKNLVACKNIIYIWNATFSLKERTISSHRQTSWAKITH